MKNYEKELEQLKAEFDKRIEEIKKEITQPKPKRWRAEYGEDYYFVGIYGVVKCTRDKEDQQDNYRYATGNYFKTEEEAERYRDKQILIQEIWDFAGDQSWIDWSDSKQIKFGVAYVGGYFTTIYCYDVKENFMLPFFKSEAEAYSCINHFGDRLNILL